MFYPKCIIPGGWATLIQHRLSEQVLLEYKICQQDNWRFYLVNQSRGRCYYEHKVITIPFFVLRREETNKGYIDWYVSHEIAHVYNDWKEQHGPRFMATLKRICPPASWHYETSYKKRNAVSAGISQCQALNTGEIPDDF